MDCLGNQAANLNRTEIIFRQLSAIECRLKHTSGTSRIANGRRWLAWPFLCATTCGNQGGLLAAILTANAQVHGVLFDLPHVAAMARQNLEAVGLSARCRVEAGDFFREVPALGDVYLLRTVIHDWDDERALTILRTCRSAMSEGSRLLLLEMIVPAGNTASYAKLIDLLMLVYAGGRERTEAEYRDLLMSAGLLVSCVVPTASAVSIIEAMPG